MAHSAGEEIRLFRRLFEYTRPYRVELFLSWLATAGYALFGAAIIYQVKPIFDEVAGRAGERRPVVAHHPRALHPEGHVVVLLDDARRLGRPARRHRPAQPPLQAHPEPVLLLPRPQHDRLADEPHHHGRGEDPGRRVGAGRRPAEGGADDRRLHLPALHHGLAAGPAFAVRVAAGHRPARAPRPPAARLQRDVAAALEGHHRDPAGDDLRLPRGQGVRHGGLRDLALPPRGRAPAATSTCG